MKGIFGILILLIIGNCACQVRSEKPLGKSTSKSIGIILVNHGSRSDTWRQALANLENGVRDSLSRMQDVKGIKTAFMEYTEPSLATQLKYFDSIQVSDVIIVPVFLTVSTHSFDDIPTIVGKKEDPQSLENLKIEKIERYTPNAQIHLTPLLDFSGLMKENVLQRVKALSKNTKTEGITLIGYGDATYNKEWSTLFEDIAAYVNDKVGISVFSYGWCGHIAHYNPDSTTTAIERVLRLKEKAIVIPVLLAHDEMFQIKIIGGGIEKIQDHERRVMYKPDAILPDSRVDQWILSISKEYVDKVVQDM
jgi:CbiX